LERKSIRREIVSKNENSFVVRTITEDEYKMEEAMKLLDQRTALMAQRKQQEKQLREMVEQKFWEKEFKNYEIAIEADETFIKAVKEGTEEYFKRLEAEGMKKLGFKRKEKGYDRIPRSAEAKRMQVRNEILNEIREELGLEDIQHPVMLKLRYEGFKEEDNGKEKQD